MDCRWKVGIKEQAIWGTRVLVLGYYGKDKKWGKGRLNVKRSLLKMRPQLPLLGEARMSNEKREIIVRAIEKIKKYYKPQKIILFGSFAWAKPTKDSDVDLLIVKKTKLKHRERSLTVRRMISEENALIGIDILVYTPEEIAERLRIGDSFISKIFKKGEVLYG